MTAWGSGQYGVPGYFTFIPVSLECMLLNRILFMSGWYRDFCIFRHEYKICLYCKEISVIPMDYMLRSMLYTWCRYFLIEFSQGRWNILQHLNNTVVHPIRYVTYWQLSWCSVTIPWHSSSYFTILCTYATLSMVVFLFFLSIPLLLICWGRCFTPLCGAAPHHRIQTSPSLKLIEVPQWSPGMLKVGASYCTLSSWLNNNGSQNCWSITVTVTLLTILITWTS